MLDFYIRQSKDVKHDGIIFLSEYGSDPLPCYNIKHPDPASVDAHNRYAAALYDAYNPEVLFAEVLLVPEWTQPTLSQDEVRRNGGIPPPPQPVLPQRFVIQLYNPDQQITVIHHPSTWNSGQYWEFEIPVQTFRLPSASALDKAQNDPSLSEATPKIEFRWKRENKLSKDLLCFLNGRKNPDKGRKHKEPDIPMAFFRNLKEISVYEPNVNRIDLEDPKGFEVALMLSAVAIKEVYFHPIKEAFNISEASQAQTPPALSHLNTPSAPYIATAHTTPPLSLAVPHPQIPELPYRPHSTPIPHSSRPPPTDPRSQWEIDAETARLRKQVDIEDRARKQNEKKQEKHVRRMLEEEQKAARKRKEEVDRETERLRKQYEADQKRLKYPNYHPPPPNLPPVNEGQYVPSIGPYMGGSSAYAASTSTFLGNNTAPPQQLKPKRSSFFGLRGGGREERTLMKKSSAVA